MKKGFTIIEIILSIGLIVLIGTVSIVSFNLIKKNNKEKTLNNMSDEILTALRLYIETNGEAKENIYQNYEGMAITLKQLENEGLISFPSKLDIQNGDDYVVAMLSQESDCSDITTVESWDLSNGPLYICSKGGSQNLFSVGGDAKNYSQATREPYYFKGYGIKNWIIYNSTKYRILSVEPDDSLILYHTASFSTNFNGVTQPISKMSTQCFIYCPNANESPILKKQDDGYTDSLFEGTINTIEGETGLDCNDIAKSSICIFASSCNKRESCEITGWTNSSLIDEHYGGATIDQYNIAKITVPTDSKKIHLKPCMKITGGSGDFATPYKLEAKNCP